MEDKYKIFIVEDDIQIANLLKEHLIKYQYEVNLCKDFSNVSEECEAFMPHLIVMDINLPVFDGFYWCKKIRGASKCPILFLSAKATDMDQVYAIESGGDDYVTKPFSFQVVTAKIVAQLRRVYGEYAKKENRDLICGDCRLSLDLFTLEGLPVDKQKKITLTKNETGLLRLFFQNKNRPVGRELLLEELWDDETFVEENTLNVNVSRVRKCLKEVGSRMEIKAVRSVGYRLEERGAD